VLKLTGGQWNNRGLKAPKGTEVRPTTARVRKSVLDKLAVRLPQARVLDLFAGCGLISLEVLSRGAAFACAVEKNKSHVQCIQANAASLQASSAVFHILHRDVFTWLKQEKPPPSNEAFDLIYLDPPYALTEKLPQAKAVDEVVQALLSQGWLAPQGLLLLEQSSNSLFIKQPKAFSTRFTETWSYGDTQLLVSST
jgi:16S rRNA (guanine966-N2)-methyltransferase